MTRKLTALILASMMLLAMFGTAAVAEEKAQVIVYNAFSDATIYDLRSANGADHRMLLTQTFEPLIRKTADGTFLPGGAESWELSEDGLVLTFNLRKDMKWSDGIPVTAKDYVYSYTTGVNPEFASTSAVAYEVMLNGAQIVAGEKEPEDLGVKAIDDYTLECTLAKANPFALSLFSSVNLAAVPSHIAQADSSEWVLDAKTAVGNGPFMMAEWLPKEKITLLPNPHYYDQTRVKLEKLEFVFVADPNTALNGFRNGQIDVMGTVPTTEVSKMIESGELVISPRIGTYYYAVNMNGLGNADPVTWEALSKPEVRKALNLAIDREVLVEKVTMTGETPAYGFLPEGIFGPDGQDFRKGKSYFDPKGNVEEAQKLLAEAGYPGGEGFPTIDIFYNTSETHKLIGEAVQEMWRKNLGITCTLSNKETAVFAAERREGKHQIARSGNLANNYDPSYLLNLFTEAQLTVGNEAKWLDDSYIAIMDQIKAETDVAKIFELSRQAEDILMEVMPVLPIYYYTNITAQQLDIKNLVRDAGGSLLFADAYRE
jgi:oligopeptide transport system substrate-binding protein